MSERHGILTWPLYVLRPREEITRLTFGIENLDRRIIVCLRNAVHQSIRTTLLPEARSRQCLSELACSNLGRHYLHDRLDRWPCPRIDPGL
jgi:hypothetical protein